MIFEKKVLGIYKKTLLTRNDPDGTVFYFGKEDFPALSCNDYVFFGDKGQKLSAHIYFKNEKRTDRIVMFEHGMGNGGHTAYMREINLLCEHGYTVFTYDHTGTRDSEGENIGGFSQSLADLDKAVGFVRSMPEYEKADISVVGHSWGGFSTMNITALHPEIKHAVAISGFISPRAIQSQVLGGILKFYRKAIFRSEKDAFPTYADTDARESLKGTKTKVLIIHSRDDKVCRFENHFGELEKVHGTNENVEFLAVDGKGHNPNYTVDALKYKDEFFAALTEKKKKGELATDEAKAEFVGSFDWYKMTEQDMSVWDKILAFLEK